MTALVGFAMGAGFAASLAVLVAAVAGWRPHQLLGRARSSARSRPGQAWWGRDARVRAAWALGAALIAALLTRWPVAVGATAGLVWLWPSMFGARHAAQGHIARLEAVATWTESLRDTIAGSIALEEAIRNTAAAAPAAIQVPLTRLVGSLSARVPIAQALLVFADDFDDSSVDLVVATLIESSRLRGPGLVGILSALASTAREELDMRRRIEEDRKSLRRDASIILSTTGVVALGLVVFSRDYMSPYSTVVGQIVLAGEIALFVTGLVWMRRAADVKVPDRFLRSPDDPAVLAAVYNGVSRHIATPRTGRNAPRHEVVNGQ